MSHIMPKAVALALACALTLPLAACGGDKTNQPSPDTTPVAAATPEPTPPPRPIPTTRCAPTGARTSSPRPGAPTRRWSTCFSTPSSPILSMPFSDAVPYDRQVGLDEWMVTADEYKKILQSVYDKGYILVNMGTCGVKSPARTASPAWSGTPSCSPREKSPSLSPLMM